MTGNGDALVQVLINLLANAREACEGVAKPRVIVRTRFASGLQLHSAASGAPVRLPIELRVSDNGPGVDPAMRDHIFDPFVTTKKTGQGLGLALVRKLVGEMNGRISHERDEAGGWTHFRLHMPLASECARAARQGSAGGMNILLVEDDVSIAIVITAALEAEGFAVTHCATLAERDRQLASQSFAALVSDVMLPDGDGIATLDAVRAQHPAMPVIILSAQNTLDTAVRASGTGAFEYFPKPFDIDELARTVRQAVGASAAATFDDEDEDASQALPLVGRSAPMQAVYRMITRVLRNDLTVLILGESGTGKELVAEAIHQLGHRAAGPFVAVNTAAIPAELIESELFGHEKGAFTGAVARHIGKFEQAEGGTLFLDEIGDMPMQAQTRLLRALQSGSIRRVGGREEVKIDARIVAATNRDLAPMIAAGQFREDLFYRINVVPIDLPPLRDRPDDIEALARHFLAQAASEGLPRHRLSDEAAALLARQIVARQCPRTEELHLPPRPAGARRADRSVPPSRRCSNKFAHPKQPTRQTLTALSPAGWSRTGLLPAQFTTPRSPPSSGRCSAPSWQKPLATSCAQRICLASTATPCASAWANWRSTPTVSPIAAEAHIARISLQMGNTAVVMQQRC